MFLKLFRNFRFLFDDFISNDEIESYLDEHPDMLQEILQKTNCKDFDELKKKIREINWNDVKTRIY